MMAPLNIFSRASAQTRLIRPAVLVFAAALSLAIAPLQAAAKDVNEMTYRNKGNYTAQLQVQWTTPSGNRCGGTAVSQDSLVEKGGSVTLDLTDSFKINSRLSDPPYCQQTVNAQGRAKIEPGSAVWGVIVIEGRTYYSCKASGRNHTFSESGSTAVYESTGTDRLGNQCRRK